MSSLNLCCGRNKLKDYVNVDLNKEFEPDLCFDVREVFPLDAESQDEVLLFHSIEHIQKFYHRRLFKEIHRVLKPKGRFYMSFPEFRIVAQYWLENYKGSREFWTDVLYGRQENIYDFHVVPMETEAVKVDLIEAGFKDINVAQEQPECFNTIIKCVKTIPQMSYEDVLQNDIDKIVVLVK
jgi:predicted SAM-dependent methyltransferase